MRPIVKGSIDQSVVIRIVDAADGTPEQAVEHDTAGVALWYRREGATKTAITPAALAALNTAHADGGLEHIDDGYYRLDLPDAAVATGVNGVMVGGAFTDMIVIGTYVPLYDFDPYTANVTVGGYSTGAQSFLGIIDTGTMQAGSTSTTAVLRAALSLANDIPNGSTIFIYGGTGAGQARAVDDFVGASDTVTVSPAWTTTPDNTSTYIVFSTPPASTSVIPGTNVTQFGGVAVTGRDIGLSVLVEEGTSTGQFNLSSGNVTVAATATSLATIAEGTWDSLRSAHTDSGSFGEGAASVQGDVTGDIGGLSTDAKADVNAEVDTAITDSGIAATALLVKAKTDSLTFTIPSVVDANIQRVNDVTITGNGDGAPFDV
jgi:hypothetical protein